MIGPNDFVPVLRARTQGEALLVKDLLEHEGIRVVIPGLMLTDDIGAPRQLLNLEGVEVQVPPATSNSAASTPPTTSPAMRVGMGSGPTSSCAATTPAAWPTGTAT